MIDYVKTRYYRVKDVFIGCLWRLNLTETIPAAEQDLTSLLNQADMMNKLQGI